MPFETSISDREIILNGRLYRIEAPPVGLGLQLLYALDNLNDVQDEEFLFGALDKLSWESPLAVSELRIAYRKDPKKFRRGIRALILQGYEITFETLKKAKEAKKSTGGEKGGNRSWRYWVAEYCETYNTDPASVMISTPFCLFLEMTKEIERVKLRKRLETIYGTSGGFGGVDKEKLDEWASRAYGSENENGSESPKNRIDYEEELKKELEFIKRL